MRIASYNVENLFDRPRVLKNETWSAGRPVLRAFSRLNDLIQNEPYTDAHKAEMLELLAQLKLLRTDESTYVRLRKIRGTFLRRQRDGQTFVVAKGRSSWIGWVELTTEHIEELAMRHTAMVMNDVGAEVLGVIEAESRPLLAMFSAAVLAKVGGTPYESVMLIDGNDARGIDVGLLSRYPIESITSHIDDRDATGTVFSRDCCEYHLRLPSGEPLIVMANHLKSKGYGSPDDPIGTKQRTRQATRVAEIYQGLAEAGHRNVVVVGDLNDSPDSEALAPLITGTDLTDISEHPSFDWNHRKGTYGSGNEKDKIDYVLMSPALYARATGGGVFRKGVYRGPRTKDKWDVYPTLTDRLHEASDHAAIYADINL